MCESVAFADDHCVLSEEECLDMPPSKAGLGPKASSVDVSWMAQQSVDPKASSVDVGPAVHQQQQQQQQCHCDVQGRRSPLGDSFVDFVRKGGMPGPAKVCCHSPSSCPVPVWCRTAQHPSHVSIVFWLQLFLPSRLANLAAR